MKKFTKIACITAGIMFAIGAILAISGILAGAKSGIFIDWTSHGIRIVPQKDTYTYEAYDITMFQTQLSNLCLQKTINGALLQHTIIIKIHLK